MASICKEKCIEFFIFYKDDVNWKKKTIKGFFLENDEWKRKKTVFPDVLFLWPDIVHPTRHKTKYMEISKKFKIRVNSSSAIEAMWDKLETCNILKRHGIASDGAIRQPETLSYTKENTRKLFKKHNSLFFKPRSSTWGWGIFMISKNRDDYTINYKENKWNVTAKELFIEIEKIMKDASYLVQESVDLVKYNGSVFDVRTVIQKNKKGKWVIAFMVVRKGVKGKIISNLHGGGRDIADIEKVLKELYEDRYKNILSNMRKAALNSANAFPNAGILGVDIMTDEKGAVYIIELNGTPGIYDFRHVPLKQKKDVSRNIVEYAIYLHNNKNV
ncbi:MAG: YheC/YheD family protein [Candidatus Aenigmarchaeota archaeon]|nr:YheC/YheD family protein [Candidatus Aenigmarchaeota archaeon]